jgi:YidC/Oxa1 family membrane protein insertase
MRKRSRVLGALAALLCFGALTSTALASVTSDWKQVDVTKDGKPETVAVTNLQDIAFNERGEIVGWYEKLVKGTDYKNEYGNKPTFSVSRLPTAVIPLSGTASVQPPVTSKDPQTETLTATFKYTQGGATVEKTYTIQPRKLTVSLRLNVTGVQNYRFEWRGLNGETNGPTAQRKALEVGAATPIAAGEIQNAQYASMQCCNNFLGAPGQAIIIRPQTGTQFGAKLETKTFERTNDQGKQTLEVSVLGLSLPSGVSNLAVYGGFNELVRLDQEGFQLPGVFQPNIFGQLSLAIVRLLEWLHSFVNNWGLTILLLTVLVRIAMIPLMQTQYRSMAEMQAIQPLIKELQAKYKEDPQKQNQEMMKLYQEHGVNPFSGCLPLLLQMPIFLVLWRVFSNYEFGEGFLWLNDLSLPDQWFILPVLYLATSLLQLWLSTRANPDMFRQQVIIQFVFAYVFLSFPSGVTMYGVLGNLISVAQQWIITKRTEAYMAAKGKPVILGAKPSTATVNAKGSTAAPPPDAKKKPNK